MSKKRPKNSYSAEYKRQVVELVRSSGKSQAQISRELGIPETTLQKMLRDYKPADVVAGKPRTRHSLDSSERAELESLRSEVAELRMQRDFLKKAAAFFANEQK